MEREEVAGLSTVPPWRALARSGWARLATRHTLVLGAAVAVALVYPWLFDLPYQRHLGIMVLLFAMLGQAWNILGGYCGQISLGNAIFFGIGAYTSSLLLITYDLTPWIGMVAGGLLAVVVSQIIGFPVFRLRGHYFAIATIALGEIAQTTMVNWQGGGGAKGVWLTMLPEGLLNFEFHSSKWPYYYIALAMLAAVMVLTYRIERSPLGYYFRAIKADPEAAQSVGIDIRKYKLIAIAITAFFTAIGGSFYAQYVLYIDPETVFPLLLSVQMALVAILGGVGTLWGPVIGSVVLLPLAEFVRIQFGATGQAIDLIVYGGLIMVLAAVEPNGLVGLARRRQRKTR